MTRIASDRVAIVINSFDRYADCWLPLVHGFDKYWPDCPYSIYLVTNFRDFPHPGIRVLKVGEDTSWAQRLVDALEHVSSAYILYFQEDYWLTRPVDTERMESYVDAMESHDLNYLRLLAFPPPDRDFPADPRLGLISRDGEYRTSAQIAFWRRDVLLELLVPGESVWQFEIDGTRRSQTYGDTFASTKTHNGDPYYWGISYVCTAINAGRWARAAKRYAAEEGLDVDFSNLPSETWWDDFKRRGRLGAVSKLSEHRLRLLLRDPKEFTRRAKARLGGNAGG